MLSKDKLIFDAADLANSDQVGSHILGTANAKVSSTNVSGKEGLDVNIINPITVSLDSEYAEDSAHASGDIGQFILAVRQDVDAPMAADGDYSPLQVDANGRLKVAAEVTVEAGDAEYLEDSAHASGDAGLHMLAVRQDTLASSVSADGDYASFKLNALGELYVHDTDVKAELVLANASLDAIEASVAQIDLDTSSIITELQSVNTELDSQTALLTTIDTSLNNIETDVGLIEAQTAQLTFSSGRLLVNSILDLSTLVADDAADTENPLKVGSRAVDGALSAISASGDKANLISDMYRRVYVNDAPNVGFKHSAQSITSTASEIAATPLLGRTRIMIQNLGNRAIFIGFDNTVSIANGLRVSAGAFLEMPFGEDLNIWAITDSGTQDIRILEIA